MTPQQIVKVEYQGNEIAFNDEGWINATDVAAMHGKRPVDWLNLTSTKEYIAALSELDQSEKNQLWVKTKRGGTHAGTWIHPKLVVAFTRWLDVRFSIWCDMQIDNILRGKISFKRIRSEAASTNKVMRAILQAARTEQGKETQPHHYMTEAKLVNWALTGKFEGLDRDSLTEAELHLLAKFEEKNAVLIGRGMDYPARKIIIEQYAFELRQSGSEIQCLSSQSGKG